MSSPAPNALNGTAPERTPTVNITQVTITGLGVPVSDVFVADRGETGDPLIGQSSVALTQTPVSGAPFFVFRGGLRQVPTRDYVLDDLIVRFLNDVVFVAGDTVVVDYFMASA